MQRLRENLALGIICLLPFHALLVTVVRGIWPTEFALAWPYLVAWKEIMIVVLMSIAAAEIFIDKERRRIFRLDKIDILIIALVLWLVGISLIRGIPWEVSRAQFAYGIKYDIFPLGVFFVLRRVDWSTQWIHRVFKSLTLIAGIVVVYGLIAQFLPQSFFSWLGYSDLHSLYLPDAPIAAFQQIGGTAFRRMQSVFSGPNQMGVWMLIPWSVGWANIMYRRSLWFTGLLVYWLFMAGIGFGILLSFSRASWIAAAVIMVVAMWHRLPRSAFKKAALAIASAVVIVVLAGLAVFPDVILRAASSRDHLLKPLKALQIMVDEPLGLGLGSAGPASNRVSDACVFLQAGSDAGWAADRPDLCVFAGDQQIQPPVSSRECACPLLTENWYLQIGVEGGWVGMGLFTGLVFSLIILILRKIENEKLIMNNSQLSIINSQSNLFSLLMLIGISIAA